MHHRVEHRAIVPATAARPIHLLVGALANSSVDAMAWLFAARLSAQLRRPVLIQDLAAIACAAPIGLALVLTRHATTSAAPLPDGSRHRCRHSELLPVALICPLPQGRAASARIPAADLRGHIEWLRASGCEADGLYVPQGTPERVADELAGAILRAFQTFDVREVLARLGVDLVVLTGPAVRAYLDGESG